MCPEQSLTKRPDTLAQTTCHSHLSLAYAATDHTSELPTTRKLTRRMARVPLKSSTSEGAPSLNRFLIQGWDCTDPNRALDVEFPFYAAAPRSLPEVRSVPLHHVQLLPAQTAPEQFGGISSLRART